MNKKIGIALICFLTLISCDGLKNPYATDLINLNPVIKITIAGLTSIYSPELNRWLWGFEATLTEINGISATITEIEGRVYWNKSWWLDRTVYNGEWVLLASGSIAHEIIIISSENVDRIKVFFEGEDENGNSISGAENFHLDGYPKN